MMQTPLGEIDVEDAHAHLFSRTFFGALARQKGTDDIDGVVDGLGWTRPPARNEDLAAVWARELDRHGVSRSVLISSVPGDEDAAGDVVRAYPERFYGYFMLDPLAAGTVLRARRAFEDLNLQGLCLFPAMFRFLVQDDRLRPLYDMAAASPGRVVFVHMGLLTVGIRQKLGLPSNFDMRFSNPMDLHRVAAEHPRTNFVIPHFGAGYLREALMLAGLAPNVYLDTSSSNSWTRFLTPPPTLEEVFARALDVAGPSRLLFGSDSSFFPRGWQRPVFERQCEALDSLGLSSDDAQLILGGNLRRLLSRPQV